MKAKQLLLVALLPLCSTSLSAQKGLNLPEHGRIIDGKTILKASPYHFLDSGFGAEVERFSGKRISSGIGVYYIPKLHYARFSTPSTPGLYYAGVSSFIVEPSLRYYLSQGFGQGIYTSLSLYYMRHQATDFSIYLEPSDRAELEGTGGHSRVYRPGPPHNRFVDALRFEGTTQGIGSSLCLGYQVLIGRGRNISFDVNIGIRGDLTYSDYKGQINESKLSGELDKGRGLSDDEQREITLGLRHYTKHSFIFPRSSSLPKLIFGKDNRSASFTALGYRWFPNMGFTVGFRF